MRGHAEYISKNIGDCADDIDLTIITNESEKEFILWAKVLQDTITYLSQSVKYYDELSTMFILGSRVFKRFNGTFTWMMTDLCTVISINIAKLYSEENELSLFNFITFCREHKDLFENYDDSLFESNRGIVSKMIKNYKDKIFIPRNKIYGHNDKLLLNVGEVDRYLERVTQEDLCEFVDESIKVLSSFWRTYNSHDMCFAIEGYDDYKEILSILDKNCKD